MKMKPIVAVIALLNGMIGGVMLVLPILILKAGTVLSFIIILVTGFLSFYSCYLYIQHLGDHTDIDKAIFFHFWQSNAVKVFYDFVIFLNLIFLLISYFLLIVQQWNGLLPQSILNPTLNAAGLLILILLLKYIRFGAHLLGYGIISIIMYCVFLAWMVGSAPSGPNTIPIVGTGIADLSSSMALAFSIQPFFIPVLKQLPLKQNKNYTKYTLIVYIFGGLIYIFIAYAGAFGILNRPQIFYPAETIEEYFKRGQWEIAVIQSIYLLHLYSAYGQFILIAKKRFFGMLKTMFNIKNSREGEFFTIPEIVFVVVVIGLGLGLYFANVTLQSVIEINGAVIGFFFIYFFPALMQFKCLYFTKPKKIIQIVYKKIKTAISRNEQSNISQGSMGMQALPKKKQMIQIQCTETDKQKTTSFKWSDRNTQINGTNLQNLVTSIKQPQKISIPKSKVTALLQTSDRMKDQQIAGADLSLVFSQIGEQSQKMQIKKFIETCSCQKPQGVRKVLDMIITFIMLALGLYVMIYGIISVHKMNS